jgi:hypothetical protein
MTTELNPLDFQTASAYLEYILQSEGELLWMHFDEAQRIESKAKDNAHDEGFIAGFDEGFIAGFREVGNLIHIHIDRLTQDNEQ